MQRLDNVDLYDKPNAQEEPAQDFHQGIPVDPTISLHYANYILAYTIIFQFSLVAPISEHP